MRLEFPSVLQILQEGLQNMLGHPEGNQRRHHSYWREGVKPDITEAYGGGTRVISCD